MKDIETLKQGIAIIPDVSLEAQMPLTTHCREIAGAKGYFTGCIMTNQKYLGVFKNW